MLRLNTIYVLLFLCVIIGFRSQYEPLETRYLAGHASEKTSFWIQHFIKRLPKLGVNLDAPEIDPALSTIAIGSTIGLTNDIIESSELFQVDFINTDCLCTVSLGSYAGKSSDKIPLTSPNRKLAAAVFYGQHGGEQYKEQLPNNKFQLPVNFQQAKAVLDSGHDEIFIFKSDQIDLPKAYATVYQTIQTDNQSTLLIRSLVPLAKEAQLFFVGWLCLCAILIISLLALISKAYKMQDAQFAPLVDTFHLPAKHRSFLLPCLFFAAFLVVVVGSYYSLNFNTIWENSHDKIKHIIAYFSLTTLGLAACHRFGWSKYLICIIFAMGVVIEMTQPFVGRSASIDDLIANSVGIVLGSMIASWYGFKTQATKKTAHPTRKPISQS